MKIYRVGEILDDLNNCILYKKSFNMIRFGDGGIKFIDSLLNKDIDQLKNIIKKEGLPFNNIVEIFNLWGYYARQANYIDTPEVYFTGEFWPRIKKPNKAISASTEYKMKIWRQLYSRSEFDNENFCNPESNCLMLIDIPSRTNIFDIMKNRKICIITANPYISNILYNYDITIVSIVGQYQNQYENSFKYVVEYIKHFARNYDFFIVSAGELGRIYSGMIKECGGRSIDLGFVIDYWVNGYLHPRFHKFIQGSISNKLKLVLTEEGKKYEKYI